MKRIAALLALALLAVPVVAFAQDAPPKDQTKSAGTLSRLLSDDPGTLDERFYRAFYQENGLRDFEKASALYAGVADAAAKAGDKGMQVQALLGRVRCLRTMGKADEAAKVLSETLRIDPENTEAKATSVAAAGGKSGPESLEARIRTLVGWMEQAMTSATIRELRMAGDRAVPIVAESLRKRDLQAVENAALFLSFYATPASRAALLAALRDPEVVYSSAVAETVCHPALGDDYRAYDDADLPLLDEIASRPEVDIRQRVLVRLCDDSNHPASIATLVLRLAKEPAATIRIQTLRSDWSPGIFRALEPAIRTALSSQDPGERAAAAGAAGRDADLLRGLQALVRGLLKDGSADVRSTAFEVLSKRDGLTQDDLAGLLDDPDGSLVDRAAVRLRDAAPWGETAAAAVRRAVQKALRAEIPADAIQSVSYLVDVKVRPGGFTPEEWVDLLGASWAKGFPWGASATAEFRQRILGLFSERVASSGYQPETDRWVARGVDGIPSPDGVVQWLEFWNGRTGRGAGEAWFHAAASADSRVRTLGYAALCRSREDARGVRSTEPLALPGPLSEVFPHITADLGSADEGLREGAIGIACLAPVPALAKDLRTLHDRASGEARTRYLEVLVRSAGKDALDAVRGDLASKEPAVRSAALGRLVISLGVADAAEIQSYLAGGGLPSEVAALWNDWESPPPLDLLRAFLKALPADRIDENVLEAARSLPAAERWTVHEKALGSPTEGTRQYAATRASAWRVVEAIPYLADLLDDPEEGVRTTASASLQELRNYIDLKATAARLREGGEANTFALAEGMLHDADPLKRRGAVLALAALGDRAAIGVLLKALDDQDKGVREAAIGALERLGGKPAPAPPPKKDE